MPVGEICSRDPIVVTRAETCAEAARIMREQHVGALVVVEHKVARRVPVGLITDRDLAIGVMALGLDAEETLVEAVMRPEIATVREGESIRRAVVIMCTHGVRRLPVVDQRGALVGVLAADDLIGLLAEETSGLAAVVAAGPRRECEERRALPSGLAEDAF